MPEPLTDRSLTRPTPRPEVSLPDPVDAFAQALEEATRERTLQDYALTRGGTSR